MLLVALGLRLQRHVRRGLTRMPTEVLVTEQVPLPQVGRFRGRVGACFLGLSVLYGVYAVGGFFGLESEGSFAYRLVMVFGMATSLLPVLLAPAVFVACLDNLDSHGSMGTLVRLRQLRFIGLVAVVAACADLMGPPLFDLALASVGGGAHSALPQEGMVADANARAMIAMMPIAVGLFVLVAAIAGTVIGRMTTGLSDDRRIVTRWVAGVLLVVLFSFTTVAVGELIVMHGALSPIWLAVAPPLVPFLLTCLLARNDCVRIAQSLMAQLRDRRQQMEPLALDDLVTTIQEADDPEKAAATAMATDDVDREMAALVAGIHRVVAPSAAIDESRAREIVDELTTAPPPAVQVEPEQSANLPGPGRLQVAAAVVAVWISLTTGLLLLGGADIAPPTLISAATAGALGAWATLEIACRDKARALSSAAI